MSIVLVGISHKTAGLELREKLAVSAEELPAALARLQSFDSVEEVFILSTCNRAEIVARAVCTETCCRELERYLAERCGLGPDELRPHLYQYRSAEAIRHILRVAASLDSLVVGESQILGQVKQAYAVALAQSTTAALLNRVYTKAFSVAGRIRTETAIAGLRVSVSSVAVDLAVSMLGPLNNRTVLIVGAGETAELVLKHLVENAVGRIMIANRSFEKARSLAAGCGGRALAFESLTDGLEQADIVLCSTGAPHYLITADTVQGITRARRDLPLFMIDISVPRTIDPAVAQFENVCLYNMDDLSTIADDNIKQRENRARDAEKIIERETAALAAKLHALSAVPTIVDLKQKGEMIRQAEIEKMLNKTNGFSPEQIEAIEVMTSRILNRMLHAPVIRLKKEAQTPLGGRLVGMARALFNLDKDMKKRHNSKCTD